MKKHFTKITVLALMAVALLQAPVMKSSAQVIGYGPWILTNDKEYHCGPAKCIDQKSPTKYKHNDYTRQIWNDFGTTFDYKTEYVKSGCC